MLSNIRAGIIELKKRFLPMLDRKAQRLETNIRKYMYIPNGLFRTHSTGELVLRNDGRAYRVHRDGSLRRERMYER